MSHESYVLYLTVVALAILANGGDGDAVHYAVQLFLVVVVLLCYLGIG